MNRVLVIGAQNIDIFASSTTPYIPNDSNKATIHLGFGGVGRNIAENIKRLSNDVHFLTVFTDDHFSESAKQSLHKIGINIAQSIHVKGATNSIYMGIMDHENELHLGLNDMALLKALSPEIIQSKKAFITSFPVVVIDNNLEADTIKEILDICKDNIVIMDAVSATKIYKLKNLLPGIDYLKVNHIELEALTSEKDINKAIKIAHDNGANTLLVTNQASDILVSTNKQIQSFKPHKISTITNATGAGDAFISGFIHGTLNDYNIEKRIDYARTLAYLTLKDKNATSKTITLDEVEKQNEKFNRI